MKSEEFVRLKRHFYQNGWIVIELPNKEPVQVARSGLISELRQLTGNSTIRLENYHVIADENSVHTGLQVQLTEFFRARHMGQDIIEGQLDFFQQFMGPDLRVQREPHLRITRPGKPQDNIDYHRDTFYGASAFEVSVVVPFVDLSAESSLSVLSGSHVRPDSDLPTTQNPNPNPAITKGSPMHRLGFPYAPKKIEPASLVGLHPVPLKFGEALIFTIATVHGSDENRGDGSRWSTDVRVVNALAPVELSARPNYYEPLSLSVVTDRAYAHAEANTWIESGADRVTSNKRVQLW